MCVELIIDKDRNLPLLA